MTELEKVIKALECRKNADKRCGNPCEDTGLCHYATAVRGLDGEIYRPFICDRERICADALSLLREQEAKTGYWIDSAGNDKCSICGEEYPDLYPDYGNTHFCPNCGAKMEGRCSE